MRGGLSRGSSASSDGEGSIDVDRFDICSTNNLFFSLFFSSVVLISSVYFRSIVVTLAFDFILFCFVSSFFIFLVDFPFDSSTNNRVTIILLKFSFLQLNFPLMNFEIEKESYDTTTFIPKLGAFAKKSFPTQTQNLHKTVHRRNHYSKSTYLCYMLVIGQRLYKEKDSHSTGRHRRKPKIKKPLLLKSYLIHNKS